MKNLVRYSSEREEQGGGTMSEERPQHPKEPAEGAEDTEEAPVVDRDASSYAFPGKE